MTTRPPGDDAAFDWDALSDQQRGVFDALCELAADWATCYITADHKLAGEFALWYAEQNLAGGLGRTDAHVAANFERWRSGQYAERHRS